MHTPDTVSTSGCLLERMTWPEVARAVELNLPVVLPVGATEQHGPHLPLGTDNYIPVGIATEVNKKIPLVIAPPIAYGAFSRPRGGAGEAFPGTLSLRLTTLLSLVGEVIAGLARTGFQRICVMNWHFENAGILWEASELATADHPDIRIVLIEGAIPPLTPKDLEGIFPDDWPGWHVEHAAIMESSLMYKLYPDLVHPDRAVDDKAGPYPPWDVIPAHESIIPKTGVRWKVSPSTEEIGRRFLELMSARLENALCTEFGL